MFDDPRPEFPERNGLKTLPIILESHLPLDLVILMLGTTDTKEMMNIPSEQSAEGIRQLVQTIQNYKVLKGSNSPKILIVVPPIVKDTADFASKLFKGATQKCTELISLYQNISEDEHTFFLDPTAEITVDEQE
jgi:lysophospholipase L1-like esterase